MFRLKTIHLTEYIIFMNKVLFQLHWNGVISQFVMRLIDLRFISNKNHINVN